MQITLTNTGKRYNREWIFRHVNQQFTTGNAYAITGPNGSGKSTLLQVIAGAMLYNEGIISYHITDSQEEAVNPHRYLSIAAPYLDLVEEMTATELLNFHQLFKPLTLSVAGVLDSIGLSAAANKQIRYFSSGMKQRLKLAQAIFSDTPILLLDEPTTNLDRDGINLYRKLMQENSTNKLIIISSNVPEEYEFCNTVIPIDSFK